jgi:hypothetical protein
MEKFEEYTKKINLVKQTIKINKEIYHLADWENALYKIASKGSELTETIEEKLKLIAKAFQLDVKIPSLSWARWLDNCT